MLVLDTKRVQRDLKHDLAQQIPCGYRLSEQESYFQNTALA